MNVNKLQLFLMLIFVVTGTVIAKKIEFKKKEFTIYFPELW